MRMTRRIVLASRSPRRIALLRQIGLNPEVLPTDVPEILDDSRSPSENARALALEKARVAASSIDDAIVIGADTIVVVDNRVLGKPADREDAIRMLTLLSGRTHMVYTGFALVDSATGESIADVERTEVTFRPIGRSEIEEYVDSGSPMDKAGAYGIQDDYGAVFVSRIEGCYYTVVGLPLSRLYMTLAELQVPRTGEKGEQ
jgi:septum formation protein